MRQSTTLTNSVEKVVLSKSMQGQELDNTLIISDRLEEHINRLKKKPGKEIIIFGSPGAAHSLMEFDLIDEFWLFVNPILLGQGIPLFSRMEDHRKLKLLSSHHFTTGVIALHYERVT